MSFVYYLDKLPLQEGGYLIYAVTRRQSPRLEQLIPQLTTLDRHQAYVLGYLLPSKGLVNKQSVGSGFLGFRPDLPLRTVLQETLRHTQDLILDLGPEGARRLSALSG